MTPRLSAILLAAGASSRMGRPKALLEYQGETFLDRQIALYASLGARVICVLGHDASFIASRLRRAGEALLVLNPAPESGQLGSLQCGLRALGSADDAFFFTPADSPGVRPETLAALLAGFDPGSADFVQPERNGLHGHPVLAAAAMAARFLSLSPDQSARDLIRSCRRRFIPVDDPFVLLDVDTPEIYQALAEGRLG